MCAADSTIYPPAMQQKRLHYLRGRLLEKRERLLRLMQAELAETDEPVGLPNDPVDVARSISAREASYEIGAAESDTIAQIDYVLRKIEQGKYGICENCGKPISPARLKVIPFACLCVECKAAEEMEAQKLAEEERTEMTDFASVADVKGDGEEEAAREALRASRPA